MKINHDLLIEENPEFTHHLYDETDCRNFIEANFDSSVLNAYNTLIPDSYKADLWRYCVLYINGGIYMDIKYQCVNNFKLISLTDKEYFVRDRPTQTVYTALIVAQPRNPILLQCINQIVENVNNKYYGLNALYPTGPGLLGSLFTLPEIQNMEIYFADTKFEKYSLDYMVYQNTIILKYYDSYRLEQSKFHNTKHYDILWKESNIYR
jgi:mannosyltransferase OCH1-like enzyme